MILVCAPTRVEARACRRGLADAGARAVEVLCTGVGPARASVALAARLRRGPAPSLVVSSGFAGALTPGIPLHGRVTASALHRSGPDGAVAAVPLPPGALRLSAGALPCRLVTGEAVRIGGAPPLEPPAAVDMESAALAETAAAAGIPISVLRIVTDTPLLPFPPFVRALGEALASRSPPARLAAAARAIGGAARQPIRAAGFVRSSLAAARALRAAWREMG